MILIVILAAIFELLIIACASPGVEYWLGLAIILHPALLFAAGIRSLRRLVIGAVVIYSFVAPNPVMLVIFTLMVTITSGMVYGLCS